MRAKKEGMSKDTIGCILPDGSLVLRTTTPDLKDKGFPAHVIRESVSLTTGSVEYWLEKGGAVPIHRKDKVTIQF